MQSSSSEISKSWPLLWSICFPFQLDFLSGPVLLTSFAVESPPFLLKLLSFFGEPVSWWMSDECRMMERAQRPLKSQWRNSENFQPVELRMPLCTLCQHQVAQDELAFMTHYRVFHQDIVKYHWQKCHFCWEYFPDFARLQAHYPVCNRGISQSVSLNFRPISSNFQFCSIFNC